MCFSRKKHQKTMQNRGPEKSSKNDAPGIRFGTQNRRKSMPERQKSINLQKKNCFLRCRFSSSFLHAKKSIKSLKKNEKMRADAAGPRNARGRWEVRRVNPPGVFHAFDFCWWNLFRIFITPPGVRRIQSLRAFRRPQFG